MFMRGLFLAIAVMSITASDIQPISINLHDSYCGGEIEIDRPVQVISFNRQRIHFSNGSKISFFADVDGGAMHNSGKGGIAVVDSSSKLFFQVESNSHVEKTGYISDIQDWQFSINTDRTDSIWNNALFIPTDNITCDTFVFEKDSEIEYSQASYLFSFEGSEIPNSFSSTQESMFDNYKSIAYLQSADGRNIKLQIVDFDTITTTSGPDNVESKYISTVRIKWAADSLGNGKFQSDIAPISMNKGKLLKYKYSPLKVNSSNNQVSFVNLVNEKSSVSIYLLNGQVLYNFNLNQINEKYSVDMTAGTYLSKVESGYKIYSTRIIVQ